MKERGNPCGAEAPGAAASVGGASPGCCRAEGNSEVGRKFSDILINAELNGFYLVKSL